MTRAATTLADPCTGAPRRDFLLGLRRGQLVGAHVPSWCSRHGWTLVAPDELARLASLQLVATRHLPRVQDGRPWSSLWQDSGAMYERTLAGKCEVGVLVEGRSLASMYTACSCGRSRWPRWCPRIGPRTIMRAREALGHRRVA